MNPVNWFEIPVNDLDRAQSFYETVLDVTLNRQDMGPMLMGWFPNEQNGTGATGTLIKGEGYTPSHDGTMVYFTVEDIEATLAKIESNGGKSLFPKTSIGEYGFIAHFEDSEGNRVSLHAVS